MQYRELILGGPGCGKTTHLLNVVETHLKAGVPPQQIAYVAFTRKAASEAKQRACYQFGLKEDDLPFFRTLHSFAFKELALSHDQLMTAKHYEALGDILKIKFGAVEDEFGIISEQRERGSQYYHIEQQARLRQISLKEMCYIDGRQGHWLVQHYQDTLNAFKKQHRVLDYTDILEVWHKRMYELPVKVLIVDEAQDLSPLQWSIVQSMERNVPFIYYAGDDDQAIYQWAGADIKHFLTLNCERKVLPVSYRLPLQVFTRCNRIVQRIKSRYEKSWRPTEREGSVSVVGAPELAPLGVGEWMILARNHYHLETTAAFLKIKGYVFSLSGKSSLSSPDALAVRAWRRAQLCELICVGDIKRILSKFPKYALKCPTQKLFAMDEALTVPREVLREQYGVDLDKDWDQCLVLRPDERMYIKSVLLRTKDLDSPPRIKISTIHAVKGGECDNVLLLADMSAACHDSFIKTPDLESRVFYVGASRAKEQLVICQPQTSNYFPL